MDDRQMQAGDTVGGEVDGVTAVFEVIAQVGGNVAIVFDDENSHWDLCFRVFDGKD
jgi:hypothetical protein